MSDAGRFQASHFLMSEGWPPVTTLTNPSCQFNLDFWRALQLHHFLHSLPSPTNFHQPLTTLEEYCTEDGILPHVLSITYKLLIMPPDNFQLPCLVQWEQDLNSTFSPNQCNNILCFIYKSSICKKILETNFKIWTRWYPTPSELHRFFPMTTDRCWRCQEGRGTLLHIFWSCPKLTQFWKEVQKISKHSQSDRSRMIQPFFFSTLPIFQQKLEIYYPSPPLCRQNVFSSQLEKSTATNHWSLA